MNTETYSFLWNKIIHPCITECMKKYDPKLIYLQEKCGLKDKILKAYEESRDNVKEKFYSQSENIEDIKIDNHKISACFTEAFIKVKACSYKINDKNIVKKVGLVNYEIAFSVGIGILYATLLSYYKLADSKGEYFKQLKKQETLKMPPTTPSHDDYKLGRIKTLALNDLRRIDFDVLTYSDMLFWIEYFNRQSIEQSVDIIYKEVN